MECGNSKDFRRVNLIRESTGQSQGTAPLSIWPWLPALVACWVLANVGLADAGYRGPFEGRVLDAETREPIQGAVVFVEWVRGKPTAAGRVDSFYDAAEVLTDEEGYFRINAKWSWNPWTNWMLEARVLIFKAGYGNVHIPRWRRLNKIAEDMNAFTEEERKRVGPRLLFKIEFERSLPVFLLKYLTAEDERLTNMHSLPTGVPPQKMELLKAEESRERKALGRND